MKAIRELVEEHDAVLVALRILENVSGAIREKSGPAPADLASLLDFFSGFVDRCHHGKEEDVLFPELVRRGAEREGGPIGDLLAEHEVGRGHVRGMAGALRRRRDNGDAERAIVEYSRAYSEMLQGHIRKENTVLFPIAERIVPEEIDARLVERFEEIERNRVGVGKHEAYHAMLDDLKRRYGIA